jgi:hypothetical protein
MADNKTLHGETGAEVQDGAPRPEFRQDPDQEALRDEAHRLGVEAVARALEQAA